MAHFEQDSISLQVGKLGRNSSKDMPAGRIVKRFGVWNGLLDLKFKTEGRMSDHFGKVDVAFLRLAAMGHLGKESMQTAMTFSSV